MAKTIIGIFKDRAEADRGVDALIHYGYKNDEVSIISKDSRQFEYEHPKPLKSETDTPKNFILGILIGAITGGLVGFALFYIPGFAPRTDILMTSLGLLKFTGVIGIVTLGALIGLILGGIAGIASTMEVPRRRAVGRTWFENQKPNIYNSEVIIAVPASNPEENEVKEILKQWGAKSFQTIDVTEYDEAEAARVEYAPAGFGLSGIKGGRRVGHRMIKSREQARIEDIEED